MTDWDCDRDWLWLRLTVTETDCDWDWLRLAETETDWLRLWLTVTETDWLRLRLRLTETKTECDWLRLAATETDWDWDWLRLMDGWVRVLRPFNSISVTLRQWKDEHERLCAVKRCLGSGRILPPAGFEPATPWTKVGSANRSAMRTLRLRLRLTELKLTDWDWDWLNWDWLTDRPTDRLTETDCAWDWLRPTDWDWLKLTETETDWDWLQLTETDCGLTSRSTLIRSCGDAAFQFYPNWDKSQTQALLWAFSIKFFSKLSWTDMEGIWW